MTERQGKCDARGDRKLGAPSFRRSSGERVGRHKSRATISALLTLAALLAIVSITACNKQDFPQYPANYREYAYVANSGSGTVTVVDVVNVRVDREIPVGQNPVAVAASPKRNEVYVVNAGPEGALRDRCGKERGCGDDSAASQAGVD
jgi:YVTN family beta-propeller protein